MAWLLFASLVRGDTLLTDEVRAKVFEIVPVSELNDGNPFPKTVGYYIYLRGRVPAGTYESHQMAYGDELRGASWLYMKRQDGKFGIETGATYNFVFDRLDRTIIRFKVSK